MCQSKLCARLKSCSCIFLLCVLVILLCGRVLWCSLALLMEQTNVNFEASRSEMSDLETTQSLLSNTYVHLQENLALENRLQVKEKYSTSGKRKKRKDWSRPLKCVRCYGMLVLANINIPEVAPNSFSKRDVSVSLSYLCVFPHHFQPDVLPKQQQQSTSSST